MGEIKGEILLVVTRVLSVGEFCSKGCGPKDSSKVLTENIQTELVAELARSHKISIYMECLSRLKCGIYLLIPYTLKHKCT